MKKILSLFLVGTLVLGIGMAVLAEDTTTTTTAPNDQQSPLGNYPIGEYQTVTQGVQIKPGQLLVDALNWVFNVVLIISIIVLIYSGYLYATAGGDQAKTKKAMSTLIYAIIGIAVALAARAIVNLVTTTLGGQNIQIKK
ncbi:MAG: hypothetical protein ACPLXL_02195 [Minisyncoccia bacterium]